MATNKKFVCELCDMDLMNETNLTSHLHGKNHQMALHRAHIFEKKVKCGIYVTGLYYFHIKIKLFHVS